MTLVLDTSAVLALFLARDAQHLRARDLVSALDEDLVTSPLAIAEMDHLVFQRGGDRARSVLWENFETGAYLARWWADALTETLAIVREHPRLGLADASLVALADRLRTSRIFTFDRHFAGMTTPEGRTLQTVP